MRERLYEQFLPPLSHFFSSHLVNSHVTVTPAAWSHQHGLIIAKVGQSVREEVIYRDATYLKIDAPTFLSQNKNRPTDGQSNLIN